MSAAGTFRSAVTPCCFGFRTTWPNIATLGSLKSKTLTSQCASKMLVAFMLLTNAAAAAEPAAVIKTFCADCHGADTQEAELNLVSLFSSPESLRGDFRRLQGILRVVESGEMPPDEFEPRLPTAARAQLVDWLRAEIAAIAEAERDDPGVVVMSRLAKHEYRNVIRDLTGGVVMNAGRLMPNEGGAGEGFANVGEAQGMSAAQFEKYVEAAKDVLRHLRVYPLECGDSSAHSKMVWSPIPREPVDAPQHAVKEATDDIIAWYVAQQQKWGEEHRDALAQKYGSAHAIYLEAAWRTRHGKSPVDAVLAPVALKKWTSILSEAKDDSPFIDWARAWRKLPATLTDEEVRAECLAIASGQRGGSTNVESEDFAPPYEISFHEAREEVLEAANRHGRWPFRIDIGEAKELFLVVTDAGDGGRGEYAVWQRGRIVFKNGSAKPWQDVVEVIGANSGRRFPWGIDGEGSKVLGPDAIGVKPPGALKFAVPKEAIVFEVELTLDTNRTKLASIQSLVLKEKPKSQSYIPGRFVFGGKKRQADVSREENKQRDRLLRQRNVAEANKTKIGLNAERNVFADWTRTEIAAIGGPWEDQELEQVVADAPYHYTVAEVRRNATADDLAMLSELEDRLVSIASPPSADELEPTAMKLLNDFARRAWRRPLNDNEPELLQRLYRESATQGLSFDSTIKVPLLAVLVSPNFLYRHLECEQSSHSKTARLNSYSLASRLSFFLWASIPDDELLQLAQSDKLQDREVLRGQVRRMLRDEKARSLATDFAGQLWGFEGFELFTGPDEERFPDFTPQLRQAMYDEVVTFLDDLFRHDRPLTRLIDADDTFANDLLIRHYDEAKRLSEGETGKGGERETTTPSSSPDLPLSPSPSLPISPAPTRRGLPGMALFLTKTSLPLRTSAVQRGVWISEQFLGREIPSPPAMVDPISDDETDEAGRTTQQQLERHRANKTCAACHAKFDPLGVALENFDAIGRWRTTLRDGGELSSTDQMPDGRKIAGAIGLRDYLLDHQHEVYAHFTRKLLGYALGRGVQPGDTALLEMLNRELPRDGYRLSFLVDAIVTSPQFLTTRAKVR